MDIHNLPEGTTPEDVAKDMETQKKYGVEYTKYWVSESGKKVFCLAHAPNAEAAEQVHREAHGMMPDKIIPVQPELAEGFLGSVETNAEGAVIFPGGADARDPGIRIVLFTDVVNSTSLTQSKPQRLQFPSARTRCIVEASELDEKMFAFNYERSSNSR
jgi:Nickel responsive protein SCO4226-like